MLAAFRFKNFRSFSEEAELSLVASESDKTLTSSLISPDPKGRKSRRLLPVAAIYGANAAGKTNVLKALSFMAAAVSTSHTQWTPGSRIPVHQHKGKLDEPASFEVEIFIDGIRYRYGFVASSQAFMQEWLYSYPTGKPRQLYFRSTENGKTTIRTGKYFGGDTKYIKSIKIKVRDNSLFLSAAAQDNHPICRDVYSFFYRAKRGSLHPHIDDRRVTLTSALLESDPSWKELFLAALRTADPSISDIVIQPVEGRSWSERDKDDDANFFEDVDRYRIYFVVGKGKSSFRIRFEEQSQGVKKLYGLMGEIVFSIFDHQLILVDELEASIHPHVARFLVDLFQDPESNINKSQIIFTTHDTNLLDRTLLRRDQIWFVEKDDCCSHLYSLLEFSPRKDADLERGYLRGRYGAIPIASMPPGWLQLAPRLTELD